MDKNQLKMIALAALGFLRSMAGSSKKLSFAIDVATQIVIDRWDEGWDTYANKAKPVKGAKGGHEVDPFDGLARCCNELTGSGSIESE